MTTNNVKMNKQVANMEDLMPLMRECLAEGKSVRFSPRGASMLPMLREGKDSVILSPVSGPLAKYDLPLYQRADGKYILHRIVGVTKRNGVTTYTCMGDNQLTLEFGVRHEQVIAVVSGFYRGGKLHSVEESGYRLYARLWYQIRRVCRFVKRMARKIAGR